MINSSKSWMADAQSWLAAPYTYTTAKCLSSHVHALQVSTLNCDVCLLDYPVIYLSVISYSFLEICIRIIYYILQENIN